MHAPYEYESTHLAPSLVNSVSTQPTLSTLCVLTVSRDMKLMDAVFEMGMAAYNRTYPKLPFEGWAAGNPLDGPRGMQKLIHVALQMMFLSNEDSQNYFSRRTTSVVDAVDGGVKSFSDKNWMTVIMDQLEDPLGAAVTLSNLLSTNEDLLRKFVSPDLIRDFARMISDLGPQERLINFLEVRGV